MLRAGTARSTAQYDRDLILAWQIERLSIMSQKGRKRQLPKLKELIDRDLAIPRQPMTWQEMKAAMKAITKEADAGDHTHRA